MLPRCGVESVDSVRVAFETPEMSECTFGGQTSSIGAARLFVRRAAAEALDLASPESDLRGDLELAVSELVTNAIEHGLGEPVTVIVSTTAGTVVVSVRSVRTPSGIADPSTWAGPLPTVRAGRGLAIVRAISDEVSVDADDATVTVHCMFRLD